MIRKAWLLVFGAIACISRAEEEPVAPESFSLHLQATYAAQHKPAFDAPYTGAYSLTPDAAHSYTFSTTFAIGAAPWKGGEAYADLEGVQGLAFSNLTGLGGFTNGELEKSFGPTLHWYRARLYVRQTIGYGGGEERIEPDMNQLAAVVDKRRLVLTAGNLSVIDMFDNNRYAHDPRTDFMNWTLMASGAYDFAADARGYTWGFAAEWYDDGWAMRAGRFAQPKESNGLPLDPHIFEHYGDQVELEKDVELVAGRKGKARLLFYRNVAIMGRFRDALAAVEGTTTPPDVSTVRERTAKYGFGVNLEQEIADHVGAFARASWNDGQSETYTFTEVERSLATGLVFGGARWGRPDDEMGAAFVANGISAAHRDYLAAGGHGFFIGDGRLNYRPELIGEIYYSAMLVKAAWLSADLQRISNPAYNADRGPATFYGARLHLEF